MLYRTELPATAGQELNLRPIYPEVTLFYDTIQCW